MLSSRFGFYYCMVFLFTASGFSATHGGGDLTVERKLFVGGNWKMNGDKASITKLIQSLNEHMANNNSSVDVVVAPPSCYLDFVRQRLHPNIGVAAQNFHQESDWASGGAYTGEISAAMLRDVDVDWVIVGHSERRQYFCESDADQVGEKALYALHSRLNVIFCVGETAEERKKGLTREVIERQLTALFQLKRANDSTTMATAIDYPRRLVIAYEPVWAIGQSGIPATPAEAQEAHTWVRQALVRLTGSSDTAQLIRVIYGGSVTAKDSGKLAAQADVDGFLVGRASRKEAEFEQIVNSLRQAMRHNIGPRAV